MQPRTWVTRTCHVLGPLQPRPGAAAAQAVSRPAAAPCRTGRRAPDSDCRPAPRQSPSRPTQSRRRPLGLCPLRGEVGRNGGVGRKHPGTGWQRPAPAALLPWQPPAPARVSLRPRWTWPPHMTRKSASTSICSPTGVPSCTDYSPV